MLHPSSVLVLAAVLFAGCARDPSGPMPPSTRTLANPTSAALAATATTNTTGIGGAMPAFYDGKVFTINFSELPPGGETANLMHNGSINNIYQSDGCMPGGKMFVSVIDAIPTDGMNPLWREVQVVFKNPASCQQFTSDNDVLAAAAAGTVTLVPTNELYRCSVIGKPG